MGNEGREESRAKGIGDKIKEECVSLFFFKESGGVLKEVWPYLAAPTKTTFD